MMNRNRIALVVGALILACAASAFAGEVAGVKMGDKLSVEGKELRLNGMGLRTKAIFKVYVAGLYVETPSKDAKTLATTDQVKRMALVMLRDVGKSKMSEALREGFEKNSKAQMPALEARLNKLITAFPDLKEGDQVAFTYSPAKGTVLTVQGKDVVTIEGRDFGQALFLVWLGADPADEALKKGIVG